MAINRTEYGTLRENLVIPQGVYFQRRWPITDPETGLPLEIGSWSAQAMIRDNPDGPVLFEWSTGGGTGIGAIGLETGWLTLIVESAESAAWTFRRGHFDIYLTDPSGHASRLVEGKALIIPAITHD